MSEFITDFIIDFETLNTTPEAILVECSAIPFVLDIANPPKFNDLVNSGIKIKFDIQSQKLLGRTTSSGTIKWWKNQGEEARKLLRPTKEDVTLFDGYEVIRDFFLNNDIKFKKSHIWTRGEMDVLWLRSWYKYSLDLSDDDVSDMTPVMFNNFREIRSVVESNLSRDQTYCPLPVGSLPGFVKHDSLHDCARDVMMLVWSKRYSYGLEDIPSEIDPNSKRGN